ncbi:MAG: hypothetical protein ACOZF2_00425 [Thermodesulfobacteriota bacterium]
MKKAITGFFLGLACLFVFSITWGNRVLSKWEQQATTENRVEKIAAPSQKSQMERESRGKKLRLFMSPFDLTSGLTFQELDDIRHNPHTRFFAFLYLLGALWMAWGLRWSRSRS